MQHMRGLFGWSNKTELSSGRRQSTLRCTEPGYDFAGQTKAGLVNHIRQRHGVLCFWHSTHVLIVMAYSRNRDYTTTSGSARETLLNNIEQSKARDIDCKGPASHHLQNAEEVCVCVTYLHITLQPLVTKYSIIKN